MFRSYCHCEHFETSTSHFDLKYESYGLLKFKFFKNERERVSYRFESFGVKMSKPSGDGTPNTL